MCYRVPNFAAAQKVLDVYKKGGVLPPCGVRDEQGKANKRRTKI